MTEIKSYTDGVYIKKNPNYHVGDSPWKAENILALIDKNSLSPSVVVEVGCGAGEILVQMQSRLGEGVEFRGYDPNPDLASFWEERRNTNLKFFNEDFFSAHVGKVDLMLCVDVFEHIPDYLGFLQRLRERATSFIFHIPLDLSVQSVLRAKPLEQVRLSAGHLHYYTKETAIEALRYSGYSVVDWVYTKTSIDTGKALRTKFANIPRRLVHNISQDWSARLFGGYSILVLADGV